ncbi:MAG: hypothetical protein KAU01_03380 [Candidatus Cloacimonetes bacterium]|nr:hypothetical protein [Candidatus Cloacimonadota bacterium]
MKRIILISVFLLLISNLFCYANFACIFTLINPSATDVAFGLDSGTANIWNTNPLSVWSNPAKLGYHNGFAYGYSHTPWFRDVFPDMYHQSSYISYGWNGIGILLPAPSAKNHWGTVMSYGEQERTDENGQVIGTFESWDADTKFALGMNTIEFMSNFLKNDFLNKIQYFGEISVGFNYDIIHSQLVPEGTGVIPDSLTAIADARSKGIGLIGRISPFNKMNSSGKFYRLDLTVGLYFLNPGKTEIYYINETQKDPLPYGTKSAFSGKLSFDMKLIPPLANDDIISLFCKNIFSVYYSQDNTQYGEKDETNPSVWGEGLELTFLDIFSYRKGQYIDREGEIVGNTIGYGFNLNYKDIIQFQYNKVKFPGGDLQYKQDKWDILFRVDFIKLYKMFNL